MFPTLTNTRKRRGAYASEKKYGEGYWLTNGEFWEFISSIVYNNSIYVYII